MAAFEALVRQYQRPVFGLAQRMLADRGDAEDVVQDTFVMVWRRLPSLDDLDAFRGWVYQIATRRCLNVLRTQSRHATVPVVDGDLETAPNAARAATAASADPAAAAEHAAQLSGLDTALQTLTDEQRACWVLREMHELSYLDIANATGLPVSTVRGRIVRARQNLVKGMDAWR